MSKRLEGVVKAYNMGYRVVDGEVISPFNGQKRKLSIRGGSDNYLRYRFTIGSSRKDHHTVNVHQLVAYQKYGDLLLDSNIVVRHLDGNSLNNFEDNIAIGSRTDNEMDKPKDVRVRVARNAAAKNRKHSNATVEAIRMKHKEGASYSQLMEEFNISSKGSLSHIIHNEYVTEKYDT